MPLDPQARQLLAIAEKAALPPIYKLGLADARQQMLDTSTALGDGPAVDSVADRTIPGPTGEISVRLYKPAGKSLPVVVFFHGGGWVIGNIDTHDGYCRSLATASNAVVVSVDYRLAPEHKFPAAAEDAYAATRWVCDHAVALGGRPNSVVVAGDSAGGNLAAVVALMARDRGGPSIARQILIYPITDCDFQAKSYCDFATGHFLTREAMIWFWDQYCTPKTERHQPYLCPRRAESLHDLPPALVLTAECDPLRDEGEVYADKLREAGVDVTLTRYDGMIHGFTRRFDALDKAHDALREVAAAVRV